MKIKLPLFALVALLFAGLPIASSSAFVAVSVNFAPPLIPVYEQPLCPAPGYLWTPGYWAYSDFGYYWVPGVWVRPPRIGFLWTPGYWGYRNGAYAFNEGYWGPTVGFYGGINYGYGYGGRGYYGGEWAGNTFRYNTAVTRVNPAVITNTYVNREVVRPATASRASFNGPKGVQAQPTAQERAAAQAKHIPPTSTQRARVAAAQKDPALHAANNKGKPAPNAVSAFRNKHAGVANAGQAGQPARSARRATSADQPTARNTDGNTRAAREARAGNARNANSSVNRARTARRAAAATEAQNTARANRAEHARAAARSNRVSRSSVAEPRRAPMMRRAAEARRARASQMAPRRAEVRRSRPSAVRQGAPAQAQQRAKKRKRAQQDQGPGQ